MTAGAWAGLAVAAWNFLWACLAWRLGRRADVRFRQRMANRFPIWWE